MKKLARILAVCLIASVCAVSASAYDQITVPKTLVPPAIDGVLDDSYFKLHDFYENPDEFVDNEDAEHAGTGSAYLTWDDENLYCFILSKHELFQPDINPYVAAAGSCMYLAILAGLEDQFSEDSQVQVAFSLSDEGTQEYKLTGSVPEADRDNSFDNYVYPDGPPFDYITVRNDAKNETYYEVRMPWSFLDRTGTYKFVEGHKFVYNYITRLDPGVLVQYGRGLVQDIYDLGGIITLGAAPAPIVADEPDTTSSSVSDPVVQKPPVPVAPKTSDSAVIYAAILLLGAVVAITAIKSKKIKA
ncbi:hypothetical protein FACS1894105_01190 [Clostridia bacterium]|nr:hypothetical protein FACS1894105_01190 [Clostridia bacterium]